MSSPEAPHFENDVLVVSPDQARVANTLTEQIIAEFADDRFDWPAEDGGEGLNAVQRTMTREGDVAIVATKARVVNEGKQLHLTRYLLELETRAFTVIPELQDLGAPIPDEDEAVNDALFELGFNQASFQDWSDYIDLLSSGKDFLQTLRSLEQKLGMSLGKVASSPRWGEIVEE